MVFGVLYQSFATSCEIYEFDVVPDKMLDNHLIKTITTTFLGLCRDACVRLAACFSINVRPSDFPEYVECDLNNSSSKANPESLMTKAGSEYQQLRVGVYNNLLFRKIQFIVQCTCTISVQVDVTFFFFFFFFFSSCGIWEYFSGIPDWFMEERLWWSKFDFSRGDWKRFNKLQNPNLTLNLTL